MLLKKSQLLAFDEVLQKAFVDRCLNHLAKKFPDGFRRIRVEAGKESLVVADALKKAQTYGIKYENDLFFYLECMMLLGQDFDTDNGLAWPNKILTDESLSGIQKINMISDYLTYISH